MKYLAVLIAILVFSSCVTAQEDLESSDPSLQWWHYKHYYPAFHFPVATTAGSPPAPAGCHPAAFHPPAVVTKCLGDCKDVRTCFADIAKAFFTHKPALKDDCCASITKMSQDCEKTIFGAYHNTFFNCLIKLHCSTKASSAPSTPAPATPAPATPAPATPSHA